MQHEGCDKHVPELIAEYEALTPEQAVERVVDKLSLEIADDIDRQMIDEMNKSVEWKCNYPYPRTRGWK